MTVVLYNAGCVILQLQLYYHTLMAALSYNAVLLIHNADLYTCKILLYTSLAWRHICTRALLTHKWLLLIYNRPLFICNWDLLIQQPDVYYLQLLFVDNTMGTVIQYNWGATDEWTAFLVRFITVWYYTIRNWCSRRLVVFFICCPRANLIVNFCNYKITLLFIPYIDYI